MSLSVKGLTNMNYTISNAALFSDAYTKSVKQIKSAGPLGSVGASQPVMYPNAKVSSKEIFPVKQMEKAQSANKAFNEVASNYEGTAIGYDSASMGYDYEMLGSTFDVYA